MDVEVLRYFVRWQAGDLVDHCTCSDTKEQLVDWLADIIGQRGVQLLFGQADKGLA